MFNEEKELKLQEHDSKWEKYRNYTHPHTHTQWFPIVRKEKATSIRFRKMKGLSTASQDILKTSNKNLWPMNVTTTHSCYFPNLKWECVCEFEYYFHAKMVYVIWWRANILQEIST